MDSRRTAYISGLLAAFLFGISAPLSKPLVGEIPPMLMAGLLYLGSGIGLSIINLVRARARRVPGRPGAVSAEAASATEAALSREDLPLLASIVVAGGILGPLLLMAGLRRLTAVSTSLLLNLEGPFTILLAVLLFREHLGRSALFAAILIVGGAVVLARQPGEVGGDLTGAILVAGACLSWGVDNNLTARLSHKDPVALARVKSIAAGVCMCVVATSLGMKTAHGRLFLAALALGAVSYGLSLLFHLRAVRTLGAAREAAVFAMAPFIGAVVSILFLRETPQIPHLAAGVLMAAGIILLLREEHRHEHTHEESVHEHSHVHDEHHRHEHPWLSDGPPSGTDEVDPAEGTKQPGRSSGSVKERPHSHPHLHAPLTHAHPHTPDLHHRHGHH
jgi:drug/metabolite transporter (DMT)-like permease